MVFGNPIKAELGSTRCDVQPCANDFVPHRWLPNGHLQTIASNFLPRDNRLPAPEERLFQVEPEIQVLCHCHWQPEREKKLTLIIVHGLEGSSESQYVIGTSNKAWQAGWSVVRMNMRNCGGSEQYAHTLYNCSMSADVGAVVRSLIEHDRLPSIALCGFSMGGNLVLKLAGEWAEEAPRQLKAVTAVSPIIDLGPSSTALHEWQNRIYEYRFLLSLYKSIKRKARLHPERYKTYPLFSIRSLREFDDRVTAYYGGFRDAEDYYERAGSARVIEHIRIPTLIIHSLDDPFIRLTDQTRGKIIANPAIRYMETQRGGHCAFIAQSDTYDGRWAEQKVIEFVREFCA